MGRARRTPLVRSLPVERDSHGNPVIDDDLLILVNAHHEAIEFALPGEGWSATLDTAAPAAAVAKKYPLQARSLAVLTRAAKR